VLPDGGMMHTSNAPSPLGTAALARLRRKLELKRDALIASESEIRERARGVSNFSVDEADIAEVAIEQQSALRQDASDSALLTEIERALRKLAAGTYGFSEESGAPLELARLEAIPWARRTAEEEDRREARRGV
jgi:DnaK suppressor protein